jgi:hypothetical protein
MFQATQWERKDQSASWSMLHTENHYSPHSTSSLLRGEGRGQVQKGKRDDLFIRISPKEQGIQDNARWGRRPVPSREILRHS